MKNNNWESKVGFFLLYIQFKESVVQFAQENIAPHAEKIDKTNYFPKVGIDTIMF